MGRGVNSGAKTKRGGRWDGARGAADAMGLDEMGGRWGGARGASQRKRGAVDGAEREQRRQNKEGRSMGWVERGDRWSGSRGAADGVWRLGRGKQREEGRRKE